MANGKSNLELNQMLREAGELFNAGKFKRALKIYLQVQRQTSSNANIVHNIACCYDNLAEYGLAKEYFQKAISLDQTNTIFHTNFGIVLLKIGEVENAISNFQKALILNPSNETAIFYQGIVHDRQGKGDEAIEFFNRSISLNPENIYALTNLGIIHASKNDFEKAFDYFNKAIALDQKHPQALTLYYHWAKSICDWDRMSRLEKLILQTGIDGEEPLMNIFRTDSLKDNLAIAKQASKKHEQRTQQLF